MDRTLLAIGMIALGTACRGSGTASQPQEPDASAAAPAEAPGAAASMPERTSRPAPPRPVVPPAEYFVMWPDPAALASAWARGEESADRAPVWARDGCRSKNEWYGGLHRGLLADEAREQLVDRLLWDVRLADHLAACEGPRFATWVRRTLRVDRGPIVGMLLSDRFMSLEGEGFAEAVRTASGDSGLSRETRAVVMGRYFVHTTDLDASEALLSRLYWDGDLTEDFVRIWVPMLLNRLGTRERVASRLLGTVAARPDRPAAAALLEIIGADVAAYEYRFSTETQELVAATLDRIEASNELPTSVSRALQTVRAARRERRNHRGMVVERVRMELDFADGDDGCRIVWPARLRATVDSVAPDIAIAPRGDCSERRMLVIGDFDDDGAEDVVLRVTDEEAIFHLLVLGGAEPRAIPMRRGGTPWDNIATQEAAAFRDPPNCGDIPLFFPHQSFWVSYEEKSSDAYYVDENGELVEQMGDAC